MSSKPENMSTPPFPVDTTLDADLLMKERRFHEAIRIYETHLESAPHDLASMMKLGICHLLNRSESSFMSIYGAISKKLSSISEVPVEVRPLWQKYESLAARVTAGALVIGGLALPGCTSPCGKPEPNTATSTTSQKPPADSDIDPLLSTHKYGASLYVPLETVEQQPSSNQTTSDGKVKR